MEGEKKPRLLYFSGEGRRTQTFCDISDPTKSYSREISKGSIEEIAKGSVEIPKGRYRVRLLTIQHGWYLWEYKISNYVSILFLWNPLNLNEIKLPLLQHNGTVLGNCILSCPPTANDEICSIFLFSSLNPLIIYYQLGDKQWTKLCSYDDIVRELDIKGNAPKNGIYTIFEDPVYCNGCLYVGMETFLGFIIVVIEKLQPNGFSINCTHDLMLKHEPSDDGRNNIATPSSHGCEEVISCLIGSNNVLFRITILHVQNKVTAVFVYKFDCSQRVWEKVENIKDKVFFISSLDPAFACQTINPEIEGGRIYIALKNCNYFYIYNIEEKSIVTSPPFSNLPKNQCYPRWFMADIGMTDTPEEEIKKSHQIREKESICNVVYLKDGEDKVHTKYALPLDVVEVVAKHIKNVLDYLQFRASNKLFRLAAPQIQWRSSSSMSMSRFHDISLCPLFVFSEKDKVFTFVHPKHDLDYKNFINFPQGERWNLDSEICCSKEGWLFLVDVNTWFQVFFNPFTKEVLRLPLKKKVIWNIRCFGMSDSPTSSECVIVELVYKDFFSKPITTAYINFLERDDRYLPFDSRKFLPYNTNPAFHNGSFYFLSITGKLAVIEAIRGNIRWKVLEELQSPCSTCFNNFLVECDGNLLSIFESPFAKGVQVFMLNESTMTWMKVESLKNHMLFVGKTSFSTVANISGMENKIYFPRFYGKNVVFYSLETNNYHTFKNDEVVNFHHTREYLNGTWIQPRWH